MKKIIILLFILIFISCNSDDDNKTPFEPVNVNFTTIGQGTSGVYGNINQSNIIIDNENDWMNLLNEISSSGSVSLDFFSTTTVDFDTHDVIAVFLEVKTNRWKVEITEIIENQESLNVTFIDNPQIGDALTQPFHIVQIPKTEKAIIFNQ